MGAAIVDSVGIENPPCLASLEQGRGHGEDVGVQTLLPGPPQIGKGRGRGKDVGVQTLLPGPPRIGKGRGCGCGH